ncbi:MAG: hypothetical protein ACK4E3_07705 [Brevundimonas sp.]|uniref:hypothetical protein n=1 Tax=Brevundimonas sp. TaxID=1871086 RepID=UPI00391CF822
MTAIPPRMMDADLFAPRAAAPAAPSLAGQKAFFAAVSGAPPTSSMQAPATARKAPEAPAAAAPAGDPAPSRAMRPGSLLDIRI